MQQYPMNQNNHRNQYASQHGNPHANQHGMMDPTMHKKQMHDICNEYHHHLVQFEATDGQVYDGIINEVNHEGVNMLVPVGEMEREEYEQTDRQFGYGGFYGHGYPRRFRRFRPHFFPFFGIRRLFFPFFF